MSHRQQLIAVAFAFVLSCLAIPSQQAQETRPNRERATGTGRKATVALPFVSKPLEITYEMQGNVPVFDGDIALNLKASPIPDPVFQSFDKNGKPLPSTGVESYSFALSVRTGERYRWPEGIVPYVINANVGHALRREILLGVGEFDAATNITLRPRTNESDYVEFVARTEKEMDGAAGRSRVGRQGGRQEIELLQTTDSPNPTWNVGKGTVLHELGHAIGLWHEHQRMDRDEHIEILWDNINARKKKFLFVVLKDPIKTNFGRHVTDGIDIGPYDPHSIMHYSAYSGYSKTDKNGRPLPIFRHKQGLSVGRGNSLSALDIKGINEIYPVSPSGIDSGSVPFVYHHPNFEQGVAVRSGSRNLKELDINDRITGVRVPKGWILTLYRHPDFRGESIRFTGPTEIPDLRKIDMKQANGKPVVEPGVFFRKVTWNDEASAVQVSGPHANLPPNGDRVVLYEHSYWRGRRLATEDWKRDLGSEKDRFNDIVSSVYVPAGRTVELYEHSNFQGQRVRIVGPMAIANLHQAPDGRSWGDRFSSLKILGGPAEEREKLRSKQFRESALEQEELRYQRAVENARRQNKPVPLRP